VLESVGVEIAHRGFFQYSGDRKGMEEKTIDVRLALELVEDVRIGGHDTVLLISADADFLPALERAKKQKPGLIVKVAFPPGHKCQAMEAVDRFPQKIEREDLEQSLFDAAGLTKNGLRISVMAERFGWAYKLKGRTFGTTA
jgi:hypothetical protein